MSMGASGTGIATGIREYHLTDERDGVSLAEAGLAHDVFDVRPEEFHCNVFEILRSSPSEDAGDIGVPCRCHNQPLNAPPTKNRAKEDQAYRALE